MLKATRKQAKIDVDQLGDLTTSELHATFKQLFPRRSIPKVKQLIISEIACHLQSQQFGGIDKATQDRLSSCKNIFLKTQVAVTPNSQLIPNRQPRTSKQLVDGTVLKRQFNGRTYEVLVRVKQDKTTFIFQNNHYRILSKIAEEITGSHWSGHGSLG